MSAPVPPTDSDAPLRPLDAARGSARLPAWLDDVTARGAAAAMLGGAVGALAPAMVGGTTTWIALGAALGAGAATALVVRGGVRSEPAADDLPVAPARTEPPLGGFAPGTTVDPGVPARLAGIASQLALLEDRLRVEQARTARVEKLATVGRMAAGIAHEVGNPLAAINSYAHVLRSRAGSGPGVTEALDALERESDRIDRIVRGLLDFARPRHLTPAPVCVNDVVAGAVRLLQDQGVMRRIELRTELDPRTPSVFGERHELEQAFVNLLLNAADAVGGRGLVALVTREVSVQELRAAARRRNDEAGDVLTPRRPNRRIDEWLVGSPATPERVVQIVVADSGPGIAPADAERVFDPFYTTKEPGRGTGLGLAIVARTIEQLGGAIWVQRAREGGAAFVLVLPLAPPTAALTTTAEQRAAAQLDLPLHAK